MLAEAITTGGVLAVALGAIEIAKAAIAKKNGNKNGNKNDTSHVREIKEFVAMATANGQKIDQNEKTLGQMLNELRSQTASLGAIETVILRERRE